MDAPAVQAPTPRDSKSDNVYDPWTINPGLVQAHVKVDCTNARNVQCYTKLFTGFMSDRPCGDKTS